MIIYKGYFECIDNIFCDLIKYSFSLKEDSNLNKNYADKCFCNIKKKDLYDVHPSLPFYCKSIIIMKLKHRITQPKKISNYKIVVQIM